MTPEAAGSPRYARTQEVVAMTATGLVLGFLLLEGIIACLPAASASTSAGATSQDVSLLFGLVDLTLAPDAVLLLLVMLASAVGSFIHAATSFSTHVGRGQLETGWTSWYLLRLILGPALATVFYFVVRAGFFNGDATTASVNAYGIAAIAGIVGLFSRQATEKLRELFDTLFKTDTAEDDEAEPVVRDAALTPLAGDEESVELTVTGEGFVRHTRLRVGQTTVAPTYVGPNTVRATIPRALLAANGGASVRIVAENPGPGACSAPHEVSRAKIAAAT